MPITDDGVGYGPWTEVKAKHLAKIFGMHLAITQAVLNKNARLKQHYRYIDLTAGRGYTPNEIPGSPVIFAKQLLSDRFKKGTRIDLIEQNSSNLAELRTVMDQLVAAAPSHEISISYHLGEYQRIVPNLCSQKDWREMGMVFVDHSGDRPSFETIRQVSQMRPRMEVLLYLPTTNLKRTFHTTGKLLSDHIAEMNKRFWLVRKPFRGDSLRWTFLLGSNTDIFRNYKRIQFFRLDSEQAQAFFPKLNLSTRQQAERNQLRLPFE